MRRCHESTTAAAFAGPPLGIVSHTRDAFSWKQTTRVLCRNREAKDRIIQVGAIGKSKRTSALLLWLDRGERCKARVHMNVAKQVS